MLCYCWRFDHRIEPQRVASPRYRAGVAAGLAEIERVCLRNGRTLPANEQQLIQGAYLLYRAASLHLSSVSLDQRKARWRQRPKGHSLEHLIFDWACRGMNPRYFQNYLDEDFVRVSKKLAVISNPRFVSKHVMFRYCIAATLRWTDRHVD